MPWKKSEPMEQRIEFALKALKSGNFRALCQEYGISTKTGYKWRERFLRQGQEGLAEESRRPRSSPQQLSQEEVCEIVRLKLAHPHWGPRKIRELSLRQYGQVASESSFKRVLEAAGLTQGRKKRTASEAGRLSSGKRAQGVNEIWTVDFKGWWHGTEGRCEPLTVRDEFSRYLLELRRVPNARTETVQKSFEQLFERHGLPEAIRSDNGAPFASRSAIHGLSRLSAWWVALGINLERGRPGHPQDNGAHERLHRDISRELECLSQEITQEALDLWRHEFNYQRPHESLAMRCPAELYRHSERKYLGRIDELVYEQMSTRRVNRSGLIGWKDQSLFLSHSLIGWNVGLKSTENGLIEVWFAQLLLGHIDPLSATFERIDRCTYHAKSHFKSAA
jgi:transposase InsO family protein